MRKHAWKQFLVLAAFCGAYPAAATGAAYDNRHGDAVALSASCVLDGRLPQGIVRARSFKTDEISGVKLPFAVSGFRRLGENDEIQIVEGSSGGQALCGVAVSGDKAVSVVARIRSIMKGNKVFGVAKVTPSHGKGVAYTWRPGSGALSGMVRLESGKTQELSPLTILIYYHPIFY